MESETSPTSPERVALAQAVRTLRDSLPLVAGMGLPAAGSMEGGAEAWLSAAGGGRLGCLAIVVRYHILQAPKGERPPEGFAQEVLAAVAHLIRSSIRESDLVAVLEPDTLVALSPGAEPLEGRGFQARLMTTACPQEIEVSGIKVAIAPICGYAYRGAQSPGEMGIQRLIQQARTSAIGGSGTFRAPIGLGG